jgi:hypothetical protein
MLLLHHRPLRRSRPARIRTRTDEVRARLLAVLHHVPIESGRPGSNGPRRGGSPVLFRLSYIREMNYEYARLESNQRPLPSRGSALSTELRA